METRRGKKQSSKESNEDSNPTEPKKDVKASKPKRQQKLTELIKNPEPALVKAASETKEKKEVTKEMEAESVKQPKASGTSKETKAKSKKSKKETKNDKEQPKGRRGYKICRGENCGQLVNIHKKICPHCGFQFDFLQKEEKDLDDFLTKAQKKKKNAEKTQVNSSDDEEVEAIELNSTAKKKLFYRNDFVVNTKSYLESINATSRNQFLSLYEASNLELLIKENENPLNSKIHNIKFTFGDGDSEESIKLGNNKVGTIDKIEQNGIFEKFFYAGTPIVTLSWAHTDPNSKSETSELYFGCSWQYPDDDNLVLRSDNSLNYHMTAAAFGLKPFQLLGSKRGKEGALSIYKVEIQTDGKAKDPELVYNLKHSDGPAKKISWIPQVYTDKDTIGFPFLLTTDGVILGFYIPKSKCSDPHRTFSKIEPNVRIQLEDNFITSFAICGQEPWNRMLLGDMLGNIYFIEIEPQADTSIITSNSYTVLNYFPLIHTKSVRDIQWFPGFGVEECKLFCSSSDDGYVVFQRIDQPSTPVFKFASHKRAINSHIWDLGGKFLIENTDLPMNSSKVLVFENLKQEVKKSAESLDINSNKIEQKYLSHPEGCLKCSVSYFSKNLVITNTHGDIIFYNNEVKSFHYVQNLTLYLTKQLRRDMVLATKKAKNDYVNCILRTNIKNSGDDEQIFNIQYTKSLKNMEVDKARSMVEHRLMINAIEVLPNPIINNSQPQNKNRKLETMVVCANMYGIIRVISVFS